MKNRVFLPDKQSLDQALSYIHPSFKPLLSVINELDIQKLPNKILQFCKDTYILKENEPALSDTMFTAHEQVKTFGDILNENIRQLLSISRNNYIQCLAHQFKDYSLSLKNFNFGKTILQESLFGELTQILGLQFAVKILYNYIIILQYQGDYFQVTGIPLPQTYNFKAFGERKKKVVNKNVYHYSNETIDRFHILYCSHTNRNSGIFRKNIFFENGVKKSQSFQQIKILINRQMGGMFQKNILKAEEQTEMEKYLFVFFTNCRNIFQLSKCNLQKYGSRIQVVSQFDRMLARFCRLSSNYKELKNKVNLYEIGDEAPVEDLFEQMYKQETPYWQVFLLLQNLVKRTVPRQLIGIQNMNIFIELLKDFISMKRYENFKIQDIIHKMNIFSIPWLKIRYNKKYKHLIISRGRKIVASIVILLYNKLIVPVLKYNFYVTEKHKEANKLFYYRKPLWVLISKLALKKFSEMNLEPLKPTQYTEIKRKGIDYPQGKLRLMPKKGTFRPIITFNRKRKVQGDFYKANLNQILSDTQLVLRNLKNILGTQIGYCIFDNKQISKKYDKFVQQWRSRGSPQLVYFTLDIKKCYDSIDTTKLMKIIQQTPYIQGLYLLVKYLRLYRNKKPLQQIQALPNYFNFKERSHAVPISQNIMAVKQEGKAAINIFPGKQKIITKEEINKKLKQLCQGSLISYKKQYWLQKVGIPQGLNVSGVLCSLYFAYLEKQYVDIKEGLMMRLTDDYLYLGPKNEAIEVLNGLLRCAQDNKFAFNSQKINKNFDHPLIDKISKDKIVLWIGKKINIETLEILPIYQSGSDKLAYAMNVNINRKHVKSFLKNKLKSLLTNQFASYFKPKIFGYDNLCENVGLYCKISFAKFFPFLLSLNKLNLPNQNELMLKIFQITIHEYLVYICCFMPEEERNYFYHKFLMVVLFELTRFLKQKRSHKFLYSLEKIFLARLRKYKSMIKEYEESKGLKDYLCYCDY